MLADDLKRSIQKAYSQFLQAKELKPRYGQKMMIAEIARTLGNIDLDDEGHNIAEKNIAVVEAGTGTGKTVAYLLASIPMAAHYDKTLVLSTATIALQEQVLNKDLPDLLRHSGLKFSFCLAKGRGRYLCLNKLERVLGDIEDSAAAMYEDEVVALSAADRQLYQRMMDKSAEGLWDGDRDSWEQEIDALSWSRVTTDHRQCLGRKCPNIRDCAFYNARAAMDDADVIVANHDLVLADLSLGGGAILPAPENSIYVFDEGHHLPEKALNHFACNARYRGSIRWLGQSEGQWPKQLKALDELSHFVHLAEPLEQRFKACRTVLEDGLPLIRALCESIDLEQYTPRLRFEKGELDADVESLAKEASRHFLALHELLEKLHKEIDTLINEDSRLAPASAMEAMLNLLGIWVSRAEANLNLWQSYRETAFNEKAPWARWITLHTESEPVDYELVSSPVLASGLLNKGLWSRCCGAVLTSATMRALNKFDRFKMRAGLWDNASFEAVPSPFDFSRALLQVPDWALEANRSFEHAQSLIDELPKLIERDQGTLVLFSSNAQMKQVYDAMPDELQHIIRCQGHESKQRIIDGHKRSIDRGRGSVIWGLASFAEGVDLPGDYCRHVIIAKLPFSVPDEPLDAAYAEWVEARGGNAFMEVSVPDASVRLVQACGRLLRTEGDEGTISILDKRLISKRYGGAIVNALPPFKRSF
ncbi:ATP-dependent DNA helicase DinG [Agaribacterium haliotis]|uniref:ATP-dependent DNA helicase DinG n=1 Tax=Agaribacterium haliotis TaxID=2013869 RepID=UPI000BB5966A|nr:ATP-dependent DNA helicase DinG [Agaribacterium haliotis]